MSDMNVNIDLNAIRAEVANLSDEEIQKQLVELRTKQRVQQKKYQNSDAAKSYRAKRQAQLKLMAEIAKERGLYNTIQAEAARRADEQLAGQEAEEAETVAE